MPTYLQDFLWENKSNVHFMGVAIYWFCALYKLIFGISGMRETNHWLAAGRQPYLDHYSPETLRTQWAALCDVVDQ